jgi:hypothetical protein
MHATLDEAFETLTQANAAVCQPACTCPGKWPPAQIVEHLALSFLGTAVPLERCLQIGRPLASQPTRGQRLALLAITALGRLPPRRQAPPFAHPRGASPDAALEMFRKHLSRLDVALDRCESAFGSRRRIVDHPALGGLTVSQWRRYHLIHVRHHTRQIRALERRAQRAGLD